MESINLRFKQLRKECGKTQAEMGKVLGLSVSGISEIEAGRRNVTDQHIIMLRNWNEYSINEEWLRNGTGGDENMFIKHTPMDITFNHFGYLMGNATVQKKAVLSALIEMMYQFPDDKWEYVFKQFQSCLNESGKDIGEN